MNKREIRQAAARLRNLGKQVPQSMSNEERLRSAQQGLRNEDTYEEAAACAACQQARAQSGDESALCPGHLKRALGL